MPNSLMWNLILWIWPASPDFLSPHHEEWKPLFFNIRSEKQGYWSYAVQVLTAIQRVVLHILATPTEKTFTADKQEVFLRLPDCFSSPLTTIKSGRPSWLLRIGLMKAYREAPRSSQLPS